MCLAAVLPRSDLCCGTQQWVAQTGYNIQDSKHWSSSVSISKHLSCQIEYKVWVAFVSLWICSVHLFSVLFVCFFFSWIIRLLRVRSKILVCLWNRYFHIIVRVKALKKGLAIARLGQVALQAKYLNTAKVAWMHNSHIFKSLISCYGIKV